MMEESKFLDFLCTIKAGGEPQLVGVGLTYDQVRKVEDALMERNYKSIKETQRAVDYFNHHVKTRISKSK